ASGSSSGSADVVVVGEGLDGSPVSEPGPDVAGADVVVGVRLSDVVGAALVESAGSTGGVVGTSPGVDTDEVAGSGSAVDSVVGSAEPPPGVGPPGSSRWRLAPGPAAKVASPESGWIHSRWLPTAIATPTSTLTRTSAPRERGIGVATAGQATTNE